MAGKDFSVAREGPKRIGLVWVQEARQIIVLGGEKGVGVYIATRVPQPYVNTCSHLSGWASRYAGDFPFDGRIRSRMMIVASRLPHGAQGSFIKRIRKDPWLLNGSGRILG